ncbi:two-component system response regulator DcuR [Erwinia tasmaniensis]|uniref:Transcriptional regulatory protein n=1 Tax=Erwinia tasmaniensis (strain DSM 17950 / CFBP 7177 / CIP 109463 / NCPPB 4357 / Et1/99) TaxID=465817 RepID=B2VIE4_ERWT9|nr:two-component system response regulator DcuR [Erwinia tasmaniensis]CAO96970.1 Response regulator in two-component regulatory system with DcuS [Erwinia tasmaniensis Et1/99]
MINVLVVDDDAMVAELNRCYVAQLSGFSCCAVASTLQQAKELILDNQLAIDLILLDVYLQQDNGLDLLPVLRESKRPVEVIIISSAADATTIRQSLHYGVVDYLIKPFQFSRFEEALTGWQRKKKLMDSRPFYQQADVDRLIYGNPSPTDDGKRLPKGLTPQTLRTLCLWIDAHPSEEFSTDDLAAAVNISRVSCRKYLIWLAQTNILFTSIHYGATGRPVYRYRLQAEHSAQLKQYCQ